MPQPGNADEELIEGPLVGPSVRATIPEKQEDVRRVLAIALLAIFAGEVWLSMIFFILIGTCKSGFKLADLKDFLEIILSPTVALVGSATGFYFGSKSEHPK